MNNWFSKKAFSDKIRLQSNIDRLENLRAKVHDLAYFVVSFQSGGFQVLSELINDNIVKGRPAVLFKLEQALLGENNQKIALDAPGRFQKIMLEAESLIEYEIVQEQNKLSELGE